MSLKFLYTDDKTGKFSGTTLRTWALFLLFFVVALCLSVAAVLIAFGCIAVNDFPQGVESFFVMLGGFCLGNQVFYLGKRINEAREGNSSNGGNQCSTESTQTAK
jgi:hypothetical protein